MAAGLPLPLPSLRSSFAEDSVAKERAGADLGLFRRPARDGQAAYTASLLNLRSFWCEIFAILIFVKDYL